MLKTESVSKLVGIKVEEVKIACEEVLTMDEVEIIGKRNFNFHGR